jgi:excisionase family DNA binding protein
MIDDLKDMYMTSSEAAKTLGVHCVAVGQLVRKGRIPAVKIANRWLIPRAFIEEFSKDYVGRRGRPMGWRKQKGGKS